jgi:hypothetical protein
MRKVAQGLRNDAKCCKVAENTKKRAIEMIELLNNELEGAGATKAMVASI